MNAKTTKTVSASALIKVIRNILFFSLVGYCTLSLSRPVRGVYLVPTQDKALEPFASFKVKYNADQYLTDPNQVVFFLPEELVGNPVPISMNRISQDSNIFLGANVDGNCNIIDRYLQCEVAFRDLNIDPSAVDNVLKRKFPQNEELMLRTQVAREFSGEPKGILKYKLRGGDREKFQ